MSNDHGREQHELPTVEEVAIPLLKGFDAPWQLHEPADELEFEVSVNRRQAEAAKLLDTYRQVSDLVIATVVERASRADIDRSDVDSAIRLVLDAVSGTRGLAREYNGTRAYDLLHTS